MKHAPGYPIWLTVFMLIGPLLMVGGAGVNRSLIRIIPPVGAFMVMFALFYLSKRLHEQMEALESLKQILNAREKDNQAGSRMR